MIDHRFFQTAGPFSLGRLCMELGLELPGGADQTLELRGIAGLDEAGPEELSFYHNSAYKSALEQTKAGAVLVSAEQVASVPAGTVALVVGHPYEAFGQLAALFHPEARPNSTSIHPTAVIAPDAVLGANVEIGAHVVVGEGVEIGNGTVVGAGSVLGRGVRLGQRCTLEPGCVVSFSLIGDDVRLKAGAKLGQGGFGWALGQDGQRHTRIPQLGRVIIGDAVEIGANTTVDRGTSGDTVIGAGSVLDNQCQIAHNVQLGERCVVAGRTAIGGSTVLEDEVIIGGACVIVGHLRLASGLKALAGTLVSKSYDKPITLRGVPGQEHRLYLREQATLRRMAAQATAQSSDSEGESNDG